VVGFALLSSFSSTITSFSLCSNSYKFKKKPRNKKKTPRFLRFNLFFAEHNCLRSPRKLIFFLTYQRVGKTFHQDGNKKIEQDIITNDGEDDKIYRRIVIGRSHSVLHNEVPVLQREQLKT
jgi:hypothetical protein